MRKLITLSAVYLLWAATNSYAVTTFIVTSTANTGAGTLRQAITDANATPNVAGNDIISFSGIGAGFQTITLTADLPTPIEPVTIDGYTAPGYAANAPAVTIDGSTWGFLFNNAAAVGSIVRGLIIVSATNGIEVSGVNNITITGCWIGINNAGAIPGGAPANRITGTGILLTNSDNNIIGGTAAADRNIISGCGDKGILLLVGSDNNSVYGNYIGVGTTGNTDLGNTSSGIYVDGNSITNRFGNGANTRNVISGNGEHGILILNSPGNLVASNYIGLGADGATVLLNNFHGVTINNSPTTIVGGITVAMRNVISGNGTAGNGQGIALENVSTGSSILGNFIGTDATGILGRGNLIHGITVSNSTDVLIQGNLISANNYYGIDIVTNSHRATIKSNIIGLNLANAALGNKFHGINIIASNTCVIGGTAYVDRNYISANGTAGVPEDNGISINGCNNHVIKANFIGTDLTGKLARPNLNTGLSMSTSTGNTIGGATLPERNVISGNTDYGIFFYNVDNSTVQGNYIGTDSTGNIDLGNINHGVQTSTNSDNITWQSNVIGGNNAAGLVIDNGVSNLIYGNKIGLGLDGITDVGNATLGILLVGGANNAVIGGTGANQRNYISGNDDHAIDVEWYSTGTTIKNNFIGSDVTGLIPVPNAKIGVFIMRASDNAVIGGTGANEGNLICCSATGDGIRLQVSNGVTVYGNKIGTDVNGSYAPGFGNAEHGIFMISYLFETWAQTSNNHIIGGLGAGQANIITQSGLDGVHLEGNAGGTSFNPIIGNKIYCNSGLGINMKTNSALENEGEPAPGPVGGLTRTANTISGTGIAGHTIHVYNNTFNDGSGKCDCEGEIYLGLTTVDGSGNWSFTHGLNLSGAAINAVTATQTNATNSTSEFASCVVPLPVTLLSFTAALNSNDDAVLNWTASTEVNFSHYVVMKSEDGVLYSQLEIVPAKGAGSYSFVDAAFHGFSYYKLAMVDVDGKVKFSSAISLSEGEISYQLIPNPSRSIVNIQGFQTGNSYKIINAVGVVVQEGTNSILNVDTFAPGAYIVQVASADGISNMKLLVE